VGHELILGGLASLVLVDLYIVSGVGLVHLCA
jgi:hypothetical protein